MAGCTGSGRRRLGVLAMALTAAAGAVAQVPAQAPLAAASTPTPTRTPDGAKTPDRHGKKMITNIQVEIPNAALIEFLGEYGDTADGLDPMGLADPEAAAAKSGDGKR